MKVTVERDGISHLNKIKYIFMKKLKKINKKGKKKIEKMLGVQSRKITPDKS